MSTFLYTPAPAVAARAYPDRSLRTASLIAGIALLLMAVLASFGNFVALEPLVTPGDAARTAKDIIGSEMLFRSGIACLIVVAVLDIIVAGALRTLFEAVNRDVSTMAAWFRVAYAAVFLVALSQLVGVPILLGDADQALRAIDAFTVIWHTGLVLFAIHLLLIGYLAYRSGFVAKIFGILLVIAGMGYLADGLGAVLAPNYSLNVARFTFVGEVALIFWLLIRGSRLTTRHDAGEPNDI
jgi:hypothetical protein